MTQSRDAMEGTSFTHFTSPGTVIATTRAKHEGLGQISTGHGHSVQRNPSSSSRHNRNELQRTASGSRPHASIECDIPDSFLNLDHVSKESTDQNRRQERPQRQRSQENRETSTTSRVEPPTAGRMQRSSSRISDRKARLLQRPESAPRANYHVPDSYVNIAEVSLDGPVAERHGHGADEIRVSRFATEFFTISYLILYSMFGTLARLGLQALTFYPGAPISFSSVWPNFAGSLVMGFLSEDRMLFLHEWGTPTYEQQIRRAQQLGTDEESGELSPEGPEVVDLAAAKKAHMAIKKTIPLYIGLATGFCGSFTSFSSFMRDIFLALSNDLPTPDLGYATTARNGGYSVMAVLAVTIATISLSLGGLFVGAHLAIALEPIMPSLPFVFTRRIIDRVSVFVAWFAWVGAILLTVWPSDLHSNPAASETWRGRATFSLVFAPLGCLARFYTSLYLNGHIASFPLGTFAVNMAGTTILGMAWDFAHVPLGGVLGCQVFQGIEDGFCGCLTTVSTWVAELVALRRRDAYVYGGTSVAVGLFIMVAIMGGLRWSEEFSGLVCVN